MINTQCDRVATSLILYDVARGVTVGAPHTMRVVRSTDLGVAFIAAHLALNTIDNHRFFVTRVALWAGQQRGTGHGIHPCG